MQPIRVSSDGLYVRLSTEELVLLSNALNEVCDGVGLDDGEFHARLGSERPVAHELLDAIHGLVETSRTS